MSDRGTPFVARTICPQCGSSVLITLWALVSIDATGGLELDPIHATSPAREHFPNCPGGKR